MNVITEKSSTAAMYGGSGMATFAGLLPGDWQAVGVICGIVLGIAGYATSVYFKLEHLRLARKHAGALEGDE